MLRVTAILEGGLDLEKGEEIPRSIVVTNGKRTVTIPVPDHKVKEMVDMFAEELGTKAPPDAEPSAPAPAPKAPARPTKVPETKALFEVETEAPPSMPVIEEAGFEPGEEYEESGTGVASL